MNNIQLCKYITIWLSIHLFDNWIISTFWLLWIGLLWTWVHKFFFEFLFQSFWIIYTELELLSHENCIVSFMRNCQTVFYSGFSILHSYLQCIKVPILPHSHKPFFFIITIPVSVKRYIIMPLICIYLMTREFEHGHRLNVYVSHKIHMLNM